MGCQSPNRHTTLKRLEQIKANNYRSENGLVDYCADEIDQMIITKQEKQAQEAITARRREEAETQHQAETIDPMAGVLATMSRGCAMDVVVEEVGFMFDNGAELSPRLLKALLQIQRNEIKKLSLTKQQPF